MSTPFRYFHEEVVLVKKTRLFRTLAEAVLDYDREWIQPVPTAHKTRGPLSPGGCGLHWWVVRTMYFADRADEKPSDWYIANFRCPLDAFAFAETHDKHAKKYKRTYETYRIEFHWYLSDGRREVLERLPVSWLRDIRRQRDRAEAAAAKVRAA